MQDASPYRESEPETRALRRLQTAMIEADAALARRMQLHPTDLAAMTYLSFAAEPVSPTDLSHRLGLSPAATTELVDRLTTVGHVERHRDLADRRRIRLEPSPEAIAGVFGHIDELIGALNEAARATPAEDRDAVLRYLQRATATFVDWAAPDEG